MSNINIGKKSANLIVNNRMLRVTTALTILFLAISITLGTVSRSYADKIASNESQIQTARFEIKKLQEIAMMSDSIYEDNLSMGKRFAPYSEIVPYINLLESLFAIIDPNSKIDIKNEEKQIFINRFADYEVQLEIGTRKDIFFKALDELHKSKYLTRIIDMNMNYTPDENGENNKLNKVDLTVRLFFE